MTLWQGAPDQGVKVSSKVHQVRLSTVINMCQFVIFLLDQVHFVLKFSKRASFAIFHDFVLCCMAKQRKGCSLPGIRRWSQVKIQSMTDL
jgi:hypothetical protein